MRKLIFSLSGIFILILLVGSLFVSFQGCNKDEITSPTSNNNIGYSQTGTGCSELDAMETPIYAGQTEPSGNLYVWNDATNLYVKYQFAEDYSADMLHLWVGCNLLNVPRAGKKGPPVPGQFPYTHDLNGGNTYTFTIPLTALADCNQNFGCPNTPANIYILAHAEVNTPSNGGQTGWSFIGNTNCGKSFEQQWGVDRWGWVTCYKICCELIPPGPGGETGSETAFGKPSIVQGGWIFASEGKANPEGYPTLGLTRNRWGWAGNLTLEVGNSIIFPIYAGAGLNDPDNGTNVGTINITRTISTIIVTYNLTGATLSEVHIYLDNAQPETIAPGQYGWTVTGLTGTTYNHTFEFDPGTDGFWFIGHAVVNIAD